MGKIHRLVEIVINTHEKKKYFCVVFLDIPQIFDKVRHYELLDKLKTKLRYYRILTSWKQYFWRNTIKILNLYHSGGVSGGSLPVFARCG